VLRGRNRPFPRTRGAPGNQPTQAETTSWQSAVVANSGTVSAARFTIVNNFIAAEKAAGTWALTDDYWGLWAENVPQALVSLKQLRLAVSVSAPNFTADRGYAFDGAVNYINTGFVPSTNAVAMTGTSLRVAAYERTDVNAATTTMGSSNGASQVVLLVARSGSSLLGRVNSSLNISFTLPVADGRGYSATFLNGTLVSDLHSYKNGAELARIGSAPTMGSVLPTVALYIGALNGNGVASSFRATSIGFACAGAALSAAQEQAQYANVQAWASAVGANV
jgi:hypothetical protein